MILQMTRPVQGGIRQEKRLDIIANHLANADTTGFKRDILSFDDMFKANLTVDMQQGNLKTTDNQLDLALKDDGFFKIQTDKGIRYTRDGNFMLNNEGILVTKTGDPVLGTAGEISIQGTQVAVNGIGEIYVDDVLTNQLDIVTFENLNGLMKEGSSLFIYRGDVADEIEPENISVQQGALEQPNTQVVTEMTQMIDTHRQFESLQKIIIAFDETDAKANEVGGVS